MRVKITPFPQRWYKVVKLTLSQYKLCTSINTLHKKVKDINILNFLWGLYRLYVHVQHIGYTCMYSIYKLHKKLGIFISLTFLCGVLEHPCIFQQFSLLQYRSKISICITTRKSPNSGLQRSLHALPQTKVQILVSKNLYRHHHK